MYKVKRKDLKITIHIFWTINSNPIKMQLSEKIYKCTYLYFIYLLIYSYKTLFYLKNTRTFRNFLTSDMHTSFFSQMMSGCFAIVLSCFLFAIIFISEFILGLTLFHSGEQNMWKCRYNLKSALVPRRVSFRSSL